EDPQILTSRASRQAHLSVQKNRESLPDLNSQPVLGSVEGYTSDEKAISQALRPTREFPWTRVNKEGKPTQFQEFYLSGQSNDCAFRGIGFPSRNIAISRLLDHLNKQGDKMGKDELRQFIANDMANNTGISKQVVPQVFPRGRFDSKAALEPDNQTTYLNYIRSHNDYMLGFSSTFDEEGNLIIQDKAYGLINALAYLMKVNLYIYEIKQEASRSLWLSHSFTLKNPTSSISFLHKGVHFNRLVLATDSEGLKAAQEEENRNLDITLRSIRDEGNALGSLDPSQGSSSSSSSSSVSPISSSHAQINRGPSLERRAEEDNLRSQRSAQRVSASTGEAVARPNRTVRQASEKEIMTFIASYSQERMRNLTREESCEQAYRFLANKTSIEDNFRLMRLALDKDFSPQGKTRSDFLNELIEKGKIIVGQSKRQTKPHHYGQIFLGKLWVQRAEVIERSQKFNAQTRAYDIFESLKEENKNHRFTRTYLVDLGELLVQRGYVPRGMTQLQAYTYALDVLNSVPRLAGGGVRTQGAGSTDVYSTMHVNRAEVREHTSELTN
ncbi:MAG: hypothetical protein JNJ47_05640, partial [Alphaproteobacteria bacterium]|nr:hypothetical protein [Alphaproteobacteria bacterium]